MSFTIKQRYIPQIRWSKRGSCGNAGCTDLECCCALCAEPIGVAGRRSALGRTFLKRASEWLIKWNAGRVGGGVG